MHGTLDYDLLVTMLVVMERGAHVKLGLNFGLVTLMVCNACQWNAFKSKDDLLLCIWQKRFCINNLHVIENGRFLSIPKLTSPMHILLCMAIESYSGWLQLDVLMHAKRRKSAC